MLNLVSVSPLSSKCSKVNFTGKSVGDVKDMSYKNVLAKPLKSTPNVNFVENLKKVPNIASLEKAKTRVSNLSRYLKEDMIGFVLPEYTINGVTKGGNQWFQKGAEYLLRGSKQGAKEKDFTQIAENLYGLLATHDNYWKSDDFVGYLSTLDQTPAIKSTKQAVKNLQRKDNCSQLQIMYRIITLMHLQLPRCMSNNLPILHLLGLKASKGKCSGK